MKKSVRGNVSRNALFVLQLIIIGVVVLSGTVAYKAAAAPDVPANLQEPLLIQIKQSERRSSSLRTSLAQLKSVFQGHGLVLDQWYASEASLIVKVHASTWLDRPMQESLLATLNALPQVALTTTYSASTGQIQPAQLAEPFASDGAISEGRLRGFRQINKVALEALVHPELPHVKGLLLVSTKPEALFGSAMASTVATAAADHVRFGAHVIDLWANEVFPRVEFVEFDEDRVPMAEMIHKYLQLPWVEYAEPDYTSSELAATVNDPYANGSDGYHLSIISAPAAWDLQHDTNETIAVIDTGLWTGHPDISGNVFSDLSCISAGCTNLIANTSDPTDDQPPYDPNNAKAGGHGTHVSGIIAARANNGIGLAGVAWTAKILPIKIFNSTGVGDSTTTSKAAQAINVAVAKGAHIINCSFGVTESTTLETAITGAKNAGVVIVASAGNVPGATTVGHCGTSCDPQSGSGSGSGPNIDVAPIYPGSSASSNVITIANSNSTDTIDNSSNYGPLTVDLAAPGTSIKSTLDQNSSNAGHPYDYLTGTSMAAPHVCGTMALIRARLLDPAGPYHETTAQVGYWDLLDRVRMGVDPLASRQADVSTGGRLNAYKSLLVRSKMANLSCRGSVEQGNNIMINGFFLKGTTQVIIRGLGPSLGGLGDPYLKLFNGSGALIVTNNNWKINDANGQSQEAAIRATGVPPTYDSESAILITLGAGSYSVQLSGVGGGQGLGMIDMYELSNGNVEANDQNRAVNLSSRVMVRNSAGGAIAGLIITGQRPRRVLFRALGQTLTDQGLPGLANPQLTLRNSAGAQIAYNDDWKQADSSATGIYIKRLHDAGIDPVYPSESAILATLSSGSYTLQCSDKNGGEGMALVEAYEY